MSNHQENDAEDIVFFKRDKPLNIKTYELNGFYVFIASYGNIVVYELEAESLQEGFEIMAEKIAFMDENPELLNDRLKKVFNSYREEEPANKKVVRLR